MSTLYVTEQPMSKADFIAQAAEGGWKIEVDDKGAEHLTNGTNYAHYVCELEGADGEMYIGVTRYGSNNIDELQEEVILVSEHEDAFYEIFPSEDDEEEDLEDS